MNKRYVLGIDTSNYKTSIAVIDNEQSIVCDIRRFLKVKQGERGLRQSDALFQHVKNMPELFDILRNEFDGRFDAIAYSSRPRPKEDSYMPVFLAGESFAGTLSAALNVPAIDFSHQEGHVEAIKAFSKLKNEELFMACHFSGGTTELLEVSSDDRGYSIEIIGGSKDIAFGQVLDRAGVMMGMEFPAGKQMDKIALESVTASSLLTAIKVKDGWLNLSGIDTQTKRVLEDNVDHVDRNAVVLELFKKLSSAVYEMIIQGAEKTGINKVIMAGGVSSSTFIRREVTEKLRDAGIEVSFDDNDLSQDNAVGIALLGGKAIWR